jgi:hypothetical protein
MSNSPRNKGFEDSVTSVSASCFYTWYLILRVLCCNMLLNVTKENNLADLTH